MQGKPLRMLPIDGTPHCGNRCATTFPGGAEVNEPAGTAESELERLLQSAAPAQRLRRWLVITLVAATVIAGAAYWLLRPTGPRITYATDSVRRGDLVVLVTATGDLQPTNTVAVGTEVSGTIDAVLVDFNDQVRKGQVLARLDTERLEAAVAQSRAAVVTARARLAEAQATADESRLHLERLEHIRELSNGQLPAEEELTTARASMARADAGIATARGAITEAEARLSFDAANLQKATIVAPIDGIVLTRQVEPGQTVAASLQTPVLFTLAETLAQMELHVAVDEADVAKVQPGQPATFTVAAFGDRSFPATIETVHFAPTTTVGGVVTYAAVLSVANDALVLRPGMTATADIEVARRTNALLVPNAALRFEPPGQADAPGRGFSMLGGPPRSAFSGRSPDRAPQVWVLQDGKPSPLGVTPGATDRVSTEIVAGDLVEGQAVVVDYTERGAT